MSKKNKKILAICWGMQVAVVAAGGEVKKSSNGSHIGIAFDIELNPNGQRHPIYKGKKKNFVHQLLILMKWLLYQKMQLY